MKLSQLVGSDMYMPPEWDREFSHISIDSRTIEKGDLFIALPGVREHGEQYITTAIEKGAVAVLAAGDMSFRCEQSSHFASVPVFYANEVSRCFPQWIQSRYAVNSMQLIAVTGTNGKSSVTQYIAQLAQHYGEDSADSSAEYSAEPCAVFGTLGNGLWPELKATKNTTSDLVTLTKDLYELKRAGVNLAALEVSSHGLVQQRVAGFSFKTAVMTNLSQDHLDYHGNMEDYFAAKKQLFTDYSLQNALINIDDEYGQSLAADSAVQGKVITYGKHSDAQVRCTLLAFDKSGMHAELKTPWGVAQLVLPLMGEFNLVNVTAAIAVLALQGMDFNQLCKAAQKLRPVNGRMEVYTKDQAPLVVVDFAHTPEALRNVLSALKPWQREITTVFGCGGDRDRSKRPLMLAVAKELSDQVWLTDDNPRYEDPTQIFNDTLRGVGVDASSDIVAASIKTEHNRTTAIAQALAATKENNIVLIAGKGHETYQDIKGQKIPYNDGQFLIEQGYQCLGGGHD